MSRHDKQVLLSLAAVLAVAGMIFFFSSQTGEESSDMSGAVARFALSLLVPGYKSLSPEEQAPYLETWEYVVRKGAHFSVFALLAVTLVSFLHTLKPDWRMGWIVPLAWLIATAYAGTDEWHQTFVDARAGAFKDVMIDSVGALTALVIWMNGHRSTNSKRTVH